MTAAVLQDQAHEGSAASLRAPHVTGTPTRKLPARQSSCSNCYLQRSCWPEGLNATQLVDMDDLTSFKRKVARDAALYHEGEAFDAIYAVRSGSFKTVNASTARAEKVIGLHLRG